MQLSDRVLLQCWLFLLLATCVFSAERYTIARSSQLVVVGRIERVRGTFRSGSWHIDGTITPTEVLYGRAPTGTALHYRFTCACCPRSRSDIAWLSRAEGLWFLIRIDRKSWTSAGECSDPGYRPIEYLDEMRAFLRFRRK